MDKVLPWVMGFAAIVVLSLDFWNWGAAMPLLFGMPYWVVAFIALNLIISIYYLLFCRFYWRD